MTWLARWRARHELTPVLILTARDALASRVGGLDAGADDYLIKPIALNELAARLRAVSRRARGRPEPVWQHGALEYNSATKAVRWRGEPVQLTSRESALLELLLANPGRILSKAQIIEKLYGWGEEIDSKRSRCSCTTCVARSHRHRAHCARHGLRARRTGPRDARMTLQRRLLLLLLIGAPAIWLIAIGFSGWRARVEINELFDTQQVRLAQQVVALLPEGCRTRCRRAAAWCRCQTAIAAARIWPTCRSPYGTRGARPAGRSRRGQPAVRGRARRLPGARARGQGVARVLPAIAAGIAVAVGQLSEERAEVLRDLLLSQLLPWLLMLPVLLAVIAAGVRRALRPVHALSQELEARDADDLEPARRPRPMCPPSCGR